MTSEKRHKEGEHFFSYSLDHNLIDCLNYLFFFFDCLNYLFSLPASVLFVSCGGALSTGRGSVARFGRVCSTTGYITSGLRGPSPQALTLFGGVGFIARRQRRPEKGNADGVRGIFGTAYRVGLRPCDRTHLKNGLVPYSYVGGTQHKYSINTA